MLTRIAFTLALFGVALGSSILPDRSEIPNVKYFNCKPEADNSTHVHPTDCTRFILCGNGMANDMPCPSCVGNPALCPDGGYLEFDGVARNPIDGQLICEWPANSQCTNGPRPTTTVQPPTTTGPIGGSCNATDCTVSGDCYDYQFCEREEDANEDGPVYDTGRWVIKSCRPKFYNPKLSDGTQVAKCSTWLELDEDVQLDYLRCLGNQKPCELIPDGPCSNGYIERYDDGRTPADVRQNCPAGQVLDVSERRCVDPSVCVAP